MKLPKEDHMREALSKLPPREPRGSPSNLIRASMLPFLILGKSPEEARKLAIEKLKAMLEEIIKEG